MADDLTKVLGVSGALSGKHVNNLQFPPLPLSSYNDKHVKDFTLFVRHKQQRAGRKVFKILSE